MKRFRQSKGFTLIEMAIVLVIIGIILAGVMKGRDIVRGSQVKQFSQGFAQKWQTIASTYFDKVGQHLADGTDNGGSIAAVNGKMDGNFGNAAQDAAIHQACNDVGITPCTMIKSDLEDQANSVCGNAYNIYERTVEGEYSGKARVAVGFFSIDTGIAVRNAVIVRNVPIDVAIGLDTLIDGQADGENGSCINIGNTGYTVGQANATDTLTEGTEDTDVSSLIVPWPSITGTNNTVTTLAMILDY